MIVVSPVRWTFGCIEKSSHVQQIHFDSVWNVSFPEVLNRAGFRKQLHTFQETLLWLMNVKKHQLKNLNVSEALDGPWTWVRLSPETRKNQNLQTFSEIWKNRQTVSGSEGFPIRISKQRSRLLTDITSSSVFFPLCTIVPNHVCLLKEEHAVVF